MALKHLMPATTLLAGLAVLAGTADAATPLRLTVQGTANLPPAGVAVPERLQRAPDGVLPLDGPAVETTAPAGQVSASGQAARLRGAAVGSKAYGSSSDKWPYTTARVASSSASLSTAALDNPVTAAPYRQTGKLLMDFGEDTYQCSASLIMPNVLVTAAHCVQDFGKGDVGRATNFRWIPANTGDPSVPDNAPFGVWTAKTVVLSDSYVNGTDTCARNAKGIVCNNDMALISLNRLGGQRAAHVLGDAYQYGWNGYSYVKSPAFKNLTVVDITELGYPAAFDNGWQMQRSNSFGRFISWKGFQTTTRKQLLSTQLGTAQTGGSSGGPWLVNFGTRPLIDPTKASLGNQSDSNIVVGVTSYGYIDNGLNVQGASYFGQNTEYPLANYGGYGAGNIAALMQTMCTGDPDACAAE